MEAVRHGLVGIENFADAKGKPIKFLTKDINIAGREYRVVADSVMNVLGLRLISELASQIKEMSEVKSDVEKNSELVSQPSG